MPLPERLASALMAEVADAQRRWRAPALSVGIAREGQLAWSSHVGFARLDPPNPPHDDTQVIIGSLEKLYFATYAVTRTPTAFADLVR
ncbi:MAG: hypothetical protein ABJA74_12015, partial [Lapillicoccus sp.]